MTSSTASSTSQRKTPTSATRSSGGLTRRLRLWRTRVSPRISLSVFVTFQPASAISLRADRKQMHLDRIPDKQLAKRAMSALTNAVQRFFVKLREDQVAAGIEEDDLLRGWAPDPDDAESSKTFATAINTLVHLGKKG